MPQLFGAMTWLATLPFLAIVAAVGLRHNAVLKSVHQANCECQRYLGGGVNDGVHGRTNLETCGSRCEQLVLRSWSDETGLVCDSYQRYFRPTCDDTDFRNRTRVCIESSWSATEDVCSRAEVAARCCREQYGFLESRSPKVLRMPEIVATSILRQCAQILGVTKGEFKLYQGFWFQFPEKARRLLRCLLVRQGLYSDVRGFDAEGAYLQYSSYIIEKEETEKVFRTCADRIQTDKYRKIARTMLHCIPRNTSTMLYQVDLLPIRLPRLKCQEVVQAKCQLTCSPGIIAKLCYDVALLTENLLNEVLKSLDINEEGLLLPPVNLSKLKPKVVAECVTNWLNECLEDCSKQGIQVICSQP